MFKYFISGILGLAVIYLPNPKIKKFNDAPPIENHKAEPQRKVKKNEHNQYIEDFLIH